MFIRGEGGVILFLGKPSSIGSGKVTTSLKVVTTLSYKVVVGRLFRRRPSTTLRGDYGPHQWI